MSESNLTLDEYQHLAARTMNPRLTKEETLHHALFEVCAEIGEVHSIYQKVLQGHKISIEDLKAEIGDVMWGLAELCTVNGFSMGEIASGNIEKLRKRYPEGFDEERSLHRDAWEEKQHKML